MACVDGGAVHPDLVADVTGLALAAPDVVRVASAPVEATIAASIAVVTAAVARRGREDRGESGSSLGPASMAAFFGLVHGLGFAGALADLGLPRDEIVPALVSFNVGVELGQLAFAGAAWLAAHGLARRPGGPHAGRARLAVAYAAGTAAAALCASRIAAF